MHSHSPSFIVGRGKDWTTISGPLALAPTTNATQTASFRTNTALVLEDDRTTCWMITRFLRKSGWNVRIAGSVGEALQFMDEQIEIAFIDINLPDGNGIEFLEDLREASPRSRIIVSSSDTRIGTEHAALEAGAIRFLPKPFQPKQVINAAREALSSPPAAFTR